MRAALLLLLALGGPALAAGFDSPDKPVPLAEDAKLAPEPSKAKVEETKKAPEPNVIFITWDGVRHQELFSNAPDKELSATDTAPIFPNLHSKLAAQGVLYGDADKGNTMSIANLAVLSQPAYASMMVGKTTKCLNNECPRVTEETFEERLARELSLKPEMVATFTTWDRIALTVEHAVGATKVVISATSMPHDPDMWPRAMAHLATKPRFLYIALGDADEYGHANDYPSYLATLRQYDAWLDELVTKLAAMGDYGANTTVIVTTDHGRGVGKDWVNHGGRLTTATRIWLYARGPHVKGAGRLGAASSDHSHLDIRPTIEALMGLAPISGAAYGSPLPELLPPPPAAQSTASAKTIGSGVAPVLP